MSLKTVLVGAGFGVAVGVLLAACGSTSECNADNCNGCCDASGVCQPGNLAQACGAGGRVCAACSPDQLCQSGACLDLHGDGQDAGIDAGTDAGVDCGPSNCDGCCDESGLCQGGDSADECGTSGEACASCGAGQQCVNSACEARCDSTNCPDGCCNGETCVSPTTASACGSGGSECVACSGGESCDVNGVCRILAANGSACSTDAECLGEVCLQPGDGLPGGFCTQDCSVDSDCTSGGMCVTGNMGFCFETCPVPGSRSTCRAGYVCDIYVFESNEAQGGCIPACSTAEECGGDPLGCNSNGLCCGDATYACCDGSVCNAGLTCVDGYCQS